MKLATEIDFADLVITSKDIVNEFGIAEEVVIKDFNVVNAVPFAVLIFKEVRTLLVVPFLFREEAIIPVVLEIFVLVGERAGSEPIVVPA